MGELDRLTLCGKCLHAIECHQEHNGHFMYCSACMKLCGLAEFNTVHAPTEYSKVVNIGARKQ